MSGVPSWLNGFAGLPRLARFALRRDRLRIAIWAVALAAPQPMVALAFADLYPTAADQQVAAQTFGTPAAIAMSGPTDYLDDYTIGAMTAHQMLGFTAILVGIMSVLLVVRHTRAEEQAGRAELIRAGSVGRHAALVAGLCSVLVANVVVAALLTLAMGGSGAEGVDWTGSVLFGTAHLAVGCTFAGVAALTAQVTANARTAAGLALAVLGVSYLLRAIGDVLENGLSWASPIGWAQQVLPYVEDRVWPLAFGPAIGVLCAVLAVLLGGRRDLGAGLLPARTGRATASAWLRTPFGFAFRLHRGLLTGFAVAMFAVGSGYGVFMDQVADMIQGMSPQVRKLLGEVGDTGLAETFAATVLLVIGLLATAYSLLAVLRPSVEETAGRAEPVLGTGLSRVGWLTSHVGVALLGGAVLQFVGGFGLGALGALTLRDADFLPRIALASLAYVPAIWFVTGVGVLLYGWLPRWTPVVWVLLAYGFVDGYLGAILRFPEWMNDVDPYGHIPLVPSDDLTWTPLVALTGLAMGLIGTGLLGFRRRDLR